ncbi:hypothetical protein [Streptomyces sp. NEAU-YJ-81]|uniref:hypothetical protein n=1 Tax=Streptomyces sp. NEAU-YJ-81 TaxID=2820288 RepID=UPI001ABCB28A|nr:hypothetical protein [Streptomyces sp. NEAU-YJ-81]MBO3676122.1 hypothetical protein [Streptomyces sp. NEAU-YJ-81]
MDAEAVDGEYRLASDAYAEGLRIAYQQIPDSYRTFARRQEVTFDYTAVSRFLSGDRVAPPEFIDCLALVRRAVNAPLPAAEQARLRELWLAVMRTSGNPHHRLAYLEHQLGTVRERLMQAEERAGTDRRRFEALQTRLEALQEELGKARVAAGRARALREENTWLRRQLVAAAGYVKDTERELGESERRRTDLQETARLLEQEVAVLRRQVESLHQEAPAAVPASAGGAKVGVGAAAGTPSDPAVRTLPRTIISRIASHQLTRWQQGVVLVAGIGVTVALTSWIRNSIDWLPGMDYAKGDRPSETAKECNLETGCSPAYWSWKIPSGGAIETTFWLDISDKSQQPRGTLEILNGDRCEGTVEWAITAGTGQVSAGTVTAGKTTSVTGSAPSHSGQITISARRTDSEGCQATLSWTDARVE